MATVGFSPGVAGIPGSGSSTAAPHQGNDGSNQKSVHAAILARTVNPAFLSRRGAKAASSASRFRARSPYRRYRSFGCEIAENAENAENAGLRMRAHVVP